MMSGKDFLNSHVLSWRQKVYIQTGKMLHLLAGHSRSSGRNWESTLNCIISSCHIVDLTRQNRLKVGTNKPKLKVKMQSVSDDDVRKRLLEKPRFELAAKGVFRLGRCYIFWQGVPGLWASNQESCLTGGTRRWLVPVERSDHLPGRLHTGTSGPRNGSALPWRTLNVSR